MASAIGTAFINVEPNTRRFGQSLFEQTRRIAFRVGVGIAAAFAFRGVFNTIGDVITAASDLNETVSKIGVVFGDQASKIIALGQTSASALGLSTNAALAAAGTYGNLFRAMGLAEAKSADMSTALVKLAADLASFNNTSVEDALDAIRSGLVGEIEPLRRFGVNLTAVTIEQEAMRLGLVKNSREMKETNAATRRLSDAQDALADAQRSAAEAAENSARAVRDAARGVTDAEERLRDAQDDERTAQEALTDARRAAQRALEDLQLQVEGNSIAQERATLRVKEAEEALREARTSRDAKKIKEAELDLRDARLQVRETSRRAKRDQEELNKRRKQGIKGSEELSAAEDRLKDSHDATLDAQQALADAEERASDARLDQARQAAASARAIQQASRTVSDAQNALSEALSGSTGELSAAAKAQATYSLIMKQTSLAQGDFKRTAGGVANQMRIMKARIENAKAAIGQALLPVIQEVLPPLGEFLEDMGPKIAKLLREKVIPGIGSLVEKIGAVLGAVGPAALGAVEAFFQGFNSPDAKNAQDGVGKMADDGIRLNDFLEELGRVMREDVNPVFETLGAQLAGKEGFGKALADFGGAVVDIGLRIKDLYTTLRETVPELFDVLKTALTDWIEGIGQTARGVLDFLAGVFTLDVRRIFRGIIEFALGTLRQLLIIPKLLLGLVGTAVLGIVREIRKRIAKVDLKDVALKIVGFFTGIPKSLLKVGADTAKGFFDGLVKKFGELANHLPGIVKKAIPEPIKKFFDIHSPSRLMFGIGTQIGEGLNLGLMRELARADAVKALREMTNVPTLPGFTDSALKARASSPASVTQFITTTSSDPRVVANEVAWRLGREAIR